MKLSTLFWGVLFVLIGGLFLLNNLGIVYFEWTTIWRLWPMILVFWGLSIIVGKQSPPWYAVLLMILLMVFMVIAFVATEWIHTDFDVASSGESTHQTFEEPLPPRLERATFRLQSGAGRFTIDDTTSQLVKAETQVGFGRYELRRENSENSADLTLDFRGRSRNWNFGHSRNRADIQLNTSPVWSVYLEVGAASGVFDLRPYNVEELRIDAGASSLNVKLGDRSDDTRVRIKTGAASTRIEVPESVGCEVRLQTALSGKRIRGFEKISSNRYQTTNFDSAAKKIRIDVEAGVSQITIERY